MSWKVAPIGRGGDLLYSQAGTPSLDLRFAEKKALTDYVSGDNLVTFSRNSNATYVDSDGLIKTATTNTPRFNHDPTTGESLGLLVEEARTNILLNSATLATQSVTTSATAYTLSFYGTGTVTLSGTSTAGPLVGTGSGTANRVTLTFTPTAGTLTLTVTGTVFNAQLEAGSFPTSYIPTTGSTVTRAADVAQITGTNFSSWYNQSEGTVYCNFLAPTRGTGGLSYEVVSINDGTVNERIGLSRSFDPVQINANIVTGYSTQASFNIYPIPVGSQKVALSYKSDYSNLAASGTLSSADTNLIVPNPTQLSIGQNSQYTTYELNSTISRLTYYPVRLPDATLQTITS